MSPQLSAWLPHVHSRRFRQILITCLLACSVSAALLGSVMVMRWRAEAAQRKDTGVVLTQASQQLLRAFQSRRGTLTLLRDAFDQAGNLSAEAQKALADSAVSHTRHLLGVGLSQSGQPLAWLRTPARTAREERARLARAVSQRTRTARSWRVPSTFTATIPPRRTLLIMLEPLPNPRPSHQMLVGIFEVEPLLSDFFELTLQQPFPVQLLEGERVLYQSAGWQRPTGDRRPTVTEETVRLDAVHWVLQMQPGTTQTARTLSWFNALLLTFGGVIIMAIGVIIWLLAMRTRLLQRAVSRRTAALRRAMERLRQLATTDELTGLSNRRAFLERWQFEYERAIRYGRPLECLVIDVDGFKSINDTAGHPMGDAVLKQVAQDLQVSLRQSDVLARFGGDEFIVALPETSVAQASLVAEKLRKLRLRGPWERFPGLGPVRLSVGLSHLQPHLTAEQVIQQADADMYASRREARKESTDVVHASS